MLFRRNSLRCRSMNAYCSRAAWQSTRRPFLNIPLLSGALVHLTTSWNFGNVFFRFDLSHTYRLLFETPKCFDTSQDTVTTFSDLPDCHSFKFIRVTHISHPTFPIPFFDIIKCLLQSGKSRFSPTDVKETPPTSYFVKDSAPSSRLFSAIHCDIGLINCCFCLQFFKAQQAYSNTGTNV